MDHYMTINAGGAMEWDTGLIFLYNPQENNRKALPEMKEGKM